jgi:hypothetical protein
MRIRFSAVRALVGISLLTGLSACIFTSPTIAAELRRTSKGEQVVAPNATATTPLTVTVRDQDGNPKENVAIVWSIKSGSGTLSAVQTETNGDGETSINFTAGASTGTTIVLASQQELASSVSFTIKVQ